MQITKEKLRQIIKEEIESVLLEKNFDGDTGFPVNIPAMKKILSNEKALQHFEKYGDGPVKMMKHMIKYQKVLKPEQIQGMVEEVIKYIKDFDQLYADHAKRMANIKKGIFESDAMKKYNNMSADQKGELIDTLNDLLSANKNPDDWLEGLMIAVEIVPRRVGHRPADVKIEGDTLFLMYKQNQERSFKQMKKFLEFRQMPPSSSMMAKASGLTHSESLPTDTNPFFTLEISK